MEIIYVLIGLIVILSASELYTLGWKRGAKYIADFDQRLWELANEEVKHGSVERSAEQAVQGIQAQDAVPGEAPAVDAVHWVNFGQR